MYVQSLPTIGFGEAIKTCFKKYCTFSGRARRSEFWYFNLFLGIIMTIMSMIIFIFALIIIFENSNLRKDKYQKREDNEFTIAIEIIILFIIALIIEFILLIPLIAAGVRRLHDTGRSGLFYLLNFIPLGNIILLIFFLEDSQQNENEYGPSPKYIPIQVGPMNNNSSQTIQVNGMPAPISQYMAYPQANPYQQYQQYPQSSQIPIQENLYQGPIQVLPSNQEQIATPMISP